MMEAQRNKPRTVDVARAVGWVTFLEIVRDKVLYNVILISVLLLSIGFLSSRLTFIRPERVIMDMGLSGISLSCSIIAIFIGAGLLGKEFDRRTIYVALCHPISRAQFVLGKFVGLCGVLALNWLLLTLAYLTLLGFTADQGLKVVSLALCAGLFFALIQSMLVASLAILFSAFATTSLSVMVSIGLYLVGTNISQIRMLAARLHSPAASFILNSIATVLPNLEYYSLGTKVSYGLPVPFQLVALCVVYGGFVIAICLILAGLLIQGREV